MASPSHLLSPTFWRVGGSSSLKELMLYVRRSGQGCIMRYRDVMYSLPARVCARELRDPLGEIRNKGHEIGVIQTARCATSPWPTRRTRTSIIQRHRAANTRQQPRSDV